MTAAQQLAGRLQRRHACLLLQHHQHWGAAGCATAAELAALRQGEVEGQPWQLLDYAPAAAPPPPPPSGWQGETNRGRGELLLRRGDHTAAFALHWRQPAGGGPPQLLGLSELGLRGPRP